MSGNTAVMATELSNRQAHLLYVFEAAQVGYLQGNSPCGGQLLAGPARAPGADIARGIW